MPEDPRAHAPAPKVGARDFLEPAPKTPAAEGLVDDGRRWQPWHRVAEPSNRLQPVGKGRLIDVIDVVRRTGKDPIDYLLARLALITCATRGAE